jgi:Domain of unknown function (DUF4397)
MATRCYKRGPHCNSILTWLRLDNAFPHIALDMTLSHRLFPSFRTLLSIAFLGLIAVLTGCKATEELKTTAQIRVVHAIPDAEALTIKIKDGDTKVASIATGSTVTYTTFDSSSKEYEIRSATDGTVLATRTMSFTGGSRYTLILSGRRGSMVTSTLDEDSISPSSGKFRFRVNNLSNVGSVDVYFVSSVDAVASSQATYSRAGTKDIVFEGLKQRFSAATSFTLLATAGKSTKLTSNVVMLTYGESGTSATMLNQRARLRALHASPDGALLAFRNAGTTMFSNVPYKGNSSYVNSVSGSRLLDIVAFGASASPIASGTFALTGGEDFTLVAVNRAASIELIKLDDNNLPSTLSKARVRFVNLSPDVGGVDMLVNFSKTISALSFKSASAYQEFDTGTYTFVFNASDTSAAVASTAALDLDAGKTYTVFLLGLTGATETKVITDN